MTSSSRLNRATTVGWAAAMLRALLVLCCALVLATAPARAASTAEMLAQGEAADSQGDPRGAEKLFREALTQAEAEGGPASDDALAARFDLIGILTDLNELAEADALCRRQLDATAQAKGEQSVEYAAALMQWAGVMVSRNDEAKAVPLFRRALAIDEALPGADPEMLTSIRIALASALTTLGQKEEADALLASIAKDTNATQSLALANARSMADDYAAAEPLYELSLQQAIAESGPQSYAAAVRMAGLASTLMLQNKNMARAKQLMDDSLAIESKVLGPDHPDLAGHYDIAASLALMAGDYEGVLEPSRRASSIVEKWAANGIGKEQKSALQLSSSQAFRYRLQAIAAWHVANEKPARFDEMMDVAFSALQKAADPQAAQALIRMAERRASRDPDFAALMRQFQDLSQKVSDEAAKAVERAGEAKGERVFAGISMTEVELAQVKAEIAKRFAEAGRPLDAQLTRGDVSALLKPGEVLVMLGEGVAVPGTGGAMAFTNENAWWAAFDAQALRTAGDALRAALGATRNARGVTAAPSDDGSDTAAQAFDLAAAHEVYDLALSPFAEALKDAQHIIIVTSPGLFDIPFEASLRTVPAETASPDALRKADWLIRASAVSVLPSLASLKALRQLPSPAQAARPMAGFADPQFSGAEAPLQALPDTRDEVARLAATVSAEGNRLFTGAEASEAAVKAAKLKDFSLLAFATHGLKAGELADLAEPALALTPGDGEDGLLTASEVANLDLDADWVILSACNTASGANADAEGFSGLARAFFYAGARALLVSHWPVYSDAAVKLTTGMLAAKTQDPAIGKAEALRRSMLAILDEDEIPAHWHPSYWAPFVLLGDGG